jgi:hypothetical protein
MYFSFVLFGSICFLALINLVRFLELNQIDKKNQELFDFEKVCSFIHSWESLDDFWMIFLQGVV